MVHLPPLRLPALQLPEIPIRDAAPDPDGGDGPELQVLVLVRSYFSTSWVSPSLGGRTAAEADFVIWVPLPEFIVLYFRVRRKEEH